MTNYTLDIVDAIGVVDNKANDYQDAVQFIAAVISSLGQVYDLMRVKSIDVMRIMNSYVVYKTNEAMEWLGYGAKNVLYKEEVEIDVRVKNRQVINEIVANLNSVILGYKGSDTIKGRRIAWVKVKDVNNVENERGELYIEYRVEVATGEVL